MNQIEKLEYIQTLNPWFKLKHLPMYRDYAMIASQQSYALRRKVGAVILSQNGSLFIGYNGTPPGECNSCEDENYVTKHSVIHAEVNAIKKMVDENVSPNNSIIFITDSPCERCVENVILKYNIAAVFYIRPYTITTHLTNLENRGIVVECMNEEYLEMVRKYSISKDLGIQFPK